MESYDLLDIIPRRKGIGNKSAGEILIVSLTIVFFFFIINLSICIYSVRKKGEQEDCGVFLTQNSGNLTFIISRYI